MTDEIGHNCSARPSPCPSITQLRSIVLKVSDISVAHERMNTAGEPMCMSLSKHTKQITNFAHFALITALEKCPVVISSIFR